MKNHAKNHALTPHPIAGRHRRRRTPANLFAFASDHFLLLPLGASIALVWANTAAESYFTFAQASRFLVNEVAMAFFFALLTQEIVEAVMPGGALHSWRRWGLAFVAAAGGVAGAATTYLAYVHLNYQLVLSSAWPIACAIDIGVAYFVLKTICRRSAVLPFALLLGILTDVFGMIVVAVQHTALETQAVGTVLILVALGIAMLLRAWKVPTFWPYLAICGTVSWWALYWMGLHPALAFLPIVPLLPHEPRPMNLFAAPPDDDATHHFEHEWNHLVQLILFFFGLVNAGVMLHGYGAGTWAVLTAALIGRPVGVLAVVAVAVAVGLHLPPKVRWRELVVVALATSSGFTFALYFATGLVPLGPVLDEITIGALATIVGAAITFAAARLLKVGRFARNAAGRQAHPTRPEP